MTAVLTILARLSADPSNCGRISLFTTGCTAAGQAALAQWLAQHPKLRLVRIESCEWGVEA